MRFVWRHNPGGYFNLKRYRRHLFAGACLLALSLSGCAYQPEPMGNHLPGFEYGLLHGFLIVFSFVGSLFTHIRIYTFPNSGHWYDFGFVLGAALFLGGAAVQS
jgi:hypothetical protein